jgi:hypothetical protein
VDCSQVHVCIFGGRYGSAITEDEYRSVRERGLPCFIYFKDEVEIREEGRETDLEKAALLATLREAVRDSHTDSTFTPPDNLATSASGQK